MATPRLHPVRSRTALGISACLLTGLLAGCGAGVRTLTGGGSSPAVALLAVSAAPKLGYAWNQADKTLRPIIGIPGAAQFGESVTPAAAYESGAAEPAGTYALMLGDSQSLYRISLPDGAATPLSGKATTGSRIVFAPSGAYAFIFALGSMGGTVVSGTASAPQLRAVTFTSAATDAAVSDSGTVAVALRSATGSPIQVTPASGNPVILPALKACGGLGFIAGSDDLLMADAGLNELWRVHAASTAPTTAPVATAGLLKTPLSVAASRSGHWAVIANSADSSAVRVDLTGALPPQRTACNCQPSTVAQLAGDGAFRLTALQTGPVWISDASRSSFPVLFIPALKAGL